MKPTFALDLTGDSIGLLHRAPKGWLSVGEVAFDAADLAESLDYLRKTALGLSPMGIATKVVVPNGQILYTEVNAPGPSREDKRKQIAAALEGRTPYPVEDLVFDWSGKGATVKVAVVAKETLAEAEGFATQHRFNPVSFVAIPEAGQFVGEPWFGMTEAALTILAPGENVDRDRDAIVLLHRELPKADKPAAPVVAETAPEPAPPPIAVDDVDAPLPGLDEALTADLPVTPTPTESMASAPEPELDLSVDEPAPPEPTVEAQPATVAEQPAVVPEPEADEAPFAHVTDPLAFPDALDDIPPPPLAKPVPVSALDEDLPPAPPAAAMVAFASRRAGAPAGASPQADATTRPLGKPIEDLPPLPRPAPVGAKPLPAGPLRNGPAKGFAGLVTAPSIPGTRKITKGKAMPPLPVSEPNRPAMPGTRTLTKPGGTFASKTPPRGKPRFLGLILTALLLLCLALVAAWSSFYMASDSAATDTQAVADATTPDVDEEMLADMQDPAGMTDPLPEAEPAATDIAATAPDTTQDPPINMATEEPAPQDVVVTAPAPEPAPDTAVTTDLATAQPPAEDQDEIFLAAMDTPPPALDALALPQPEVAKDSPPDAQMPPPPFGTVYQFDANGLLKPTPDGILSPEGVMLIAGKPPLLPPSRSEVATAAASAASALPATGPTAPEALPDANDAAIAPADPSLEGFRPLPRPEGLVPAAATPEDDAALSVTDASGFASLRPLPRPAIVLAAAAAARPDDAPTDLGAQGASLTAQNEATLAAAAAAEAANPSVVAISRRPAPRPRDLSRAVEAAVAAAVREPEPQPEPEKVAAAKPEELDELNEPEVATAAPKIPTKASVAKQATFVNAINLSKTNLIGVYGSPSKRYALIRQSNGRYKKVRVGDRVDGGTVQAITDNEVRYQKGGKLVSLKMPKA